jgi:DNA-binding NarL/FixJ family response regulator
LTAQRGPDSEAIAGDGAGPDDARELPGVKRALVVEDEPSIRRTIVRTLEGFGVETQYASSLKQATALLVPPIDLVIADVRLPDGSGHSVITSALRFSPVPVLIAISGVASATEAFDLARAGAVAFLVKPFGLHELERCLRDACQARARLASSGDLMLSPLAEQALQELVRRYRFTPRQAEVLRRTAQGTRRADLPKALGISEASCKTLVRRVLSRSGSTRLSELTFAVLAAQQSITPRVAQTEPPAPPPDAGASPRPRRAPRAGAS